MTEDEIFTDLVKAAINKYPIIPSSNRCSECPIRFIDLNAFSMNKYIYSRNKINDKYAYLNKNAEHEGSTCFLIAQKMQQLKIAKVNGIFFNMENNGYIGCARSCRQHPQKIKITKLYDFNKI